MKTLAAVLVETGQRLELVDIEIPALLSGQVLVEIACSGVCHTQLLEARGHRGADPYLPHCLGHEAGGRVLETGDGVTKVGAGDRVVLSWMKGSGHDVPGTKYRWGTRTVNAGGVTTFSQHAVVSENRLTPISGTLPLRDAAMLGCAVPTGAGAVWNVARPRPGQSVAVFGAGGVGLCGISAAAIGGAFPVIAVDLNNARLEVATAMGATHRINPGATDVAASIADICPNGLDFAIEATGRPQVMQQVLEVVRPRGGTAVVVGNAHSGETVNIDPKQFNLGKRLLGTWGGDNAPDEDFPRYARFVETGRLRVDPLITRTYTLEQINDALNDLEACRVPRPLIEIGGEAVD